MKNISISIVLCVGVNTVAFCQCPPSSLKIQTPICDSPRNLKASTNECSKLKVNWKGSRDQTYIVEATYIDPETNDINKQNGRNILCDDAGNCYATIAVKEGVTVNWNVQSQCSINNVIFYSYKIEGDSVLIPYCTASAKSITSNSELSKTVRVFPNPTKRYLNIEYTSKVSGTINFQVYNSNGIEVFKNSYFMKEANNKYTLDLRSLLPGTYFLQTNNGLEITLVKFILLKN